MTSPLTPEAVAQMVADREAGTPGPWQFQIETDQDGYDEGVNVTADIVTVHWSNLGFGTDETDTRVDDVIKANARRIARLPDLEAAYLTLAAENATLREENEELDFLRHEGGPAFPQNDLSAYGMGPSEIANGGMSLRDWFAGQALAGLTVNNHMGGGSASGMTPAYVAKKAYQVADAMLAAREVRHEV